METGVRLSRRVVVGDVFDRLVVKGSAPPRRPPSGSVVKYARCLCDCGRECEVALDSLVTKRQKSCGCLKKEKFLERNSLPNGEASFNRLFESYEKGAKGRGYDFQLTRDQFRLLVSQTCHYCGSPPSPRTYRNGHGGLNSPFVANGVDRFDNAVGYTLSNCVACCISCNKLKHTSSVSEFLSHVMKIAEYQRREGISG